VVAKGRGGLGGGRHVELGVGSWELGVSSRAAQQKLQEVDLSWSSSSKLLQGTDRQTAWQWQRQRGYDRLGLVCGEMEKRLSEDDHPSRMMLWLGMWRRCGMPRLGVCGWCEEMTNFGFFIFHFSSFIFHFLFFYFSFFFICHVPFGTDGWKDANAAKRQVGRAFYFRFISNFISPDYDVIYVRILCTYALSLVGDRLYDFMISRLHDFSRQKDGSMVSSCLTANREVF